MVCDCCNKRKKLFESYAVVQAQGGIINLCSECNDLAYKIRDDANAGDKAQFEEHLHALEKREKKSKEIFIKWKTIFVKELEKKFQFEIEGTDDCTKENQGDKKVFHKPTAHNSHPEVK